MPCTLLPSKDAQIVAEPLASELCTQTILTLV